MLTATAAQHSHTSLCGGLCVELCVLERPATEHSFNAHTRIYTYRRVVLFAVVAPSHLVELGEKARARVCSVCQYGTTCTVRVNQVGIV